MDRKQPVGSQSFVKQIEEKTKNRIKLTIEETGSSRWVIREELFLTVDFWAQKTAPRPFLRALATTNSLIVLLLTVVRSQFKKKVSLLIFFMY